MELEVSVARRLQWMPRTQDEVQAGDRVMESDVHPSLVMRQEVVEEESTTFISYPDEQWTADHQAHVEAMTQQGRPVRSKRRLLAETVQGVMEEHCPPGAVLHVHVVPSEERDEGERQAVENFLNGFLLEDAE